ncbi:hypothetical protein EDE15_1001 [Edaphobacter aggregans]|uniref:Uncharacterized protein n=1 Tax=Edaphobacter aggregans TaxID=570835 RepID=A0A3R9Q913_9BACT|nr:hypothetical protein [Edaphobacter aggregans]RSL15511.1 hypothetical protein EDE15_1001 [Edaphobacter aggregans]
MKIRTQLASLIVLICVLVSPALAQNTPADPKNVDQSIDTLLGDHTKVRQLVTDLQQAVAKHDAVAVAALVHYPIRVKLHGKPTYLNNAKAFVKNYDHIITPDIVAVIQNQKYEDLFVNYQGAMFGEGEVWITGFCIDNACKPPDIKVGTIQSNTNPSTKQPSP